ncbi:MAG: esterase [Hydrogenophaga sp.]|nr:esterase [Hydrogenophaga sp.]
MQNAVMIHRLASPARLLLLFHGVGAQPHHLVPLGQALARSRPNTLVASLRAPFASDLGQGWQWFSVREVTEANRPARVAAAMPLFVQAVRDWQASCGVGPEATDLIGFSQGAIMALESTQHAPGLAHSVTAIAGRFAQPPQRPLGDTRVHLVHGSADPVMPVQCARDARDALAALQSPASLDIVDGMGHSIDLRALAAVQRHLPGGTAPAQVPA